MKKMLKRLGLAALVFVMVLNLAGTAFAAPKFGKENQMGGFSQWLEDMFGMGKEESAEDSADGEGDTEPIEGDVEPTEGDAEPTEGDTEPTEGDTEPTEGDAEPTEGDTEPTEGDTEPTEGDTEPAEGDAEPTEGDAEPTEGAEDGKQTTVENDAQDDALNGAAEEKQTEVEYVKDASGNLILDANGNPIPVNSIPEGAATLAVLVDAMNPNRVIHIYAMYDGDFLNIGDTVTLIATLTGYEGLTYNLQWQEDSGNGFADLAGETSTAYSFTLTEANAFNSWMIEVNITAIDI